MMKVAVPTIFFNKLQSNMDWISTIVAFVALAFLVQAWSWTNQKHKRLPPGPIGFPIFGSLHLLGKLPHRDLHKLSQKYGPIMSMRLGLVQAIIVSSPTAAEAFLKTHDLNFASRPSREAFKYMSYQQKNLIFAPYGSYWREMRKMSRLELLSDSKIASFRAIRKEELGLLIEYIKEVSKQRVSVDLSGKVSALVADMTCWMVMGKKYMNEEFDERGFKTAIQEGLHLAAVPNFGDYIPQIAGLDLQGLTKRMKVVSNVFDTFLEKMIDEHIHNKDENTVKDFMDIMLGLMDSQNCEYRIDRDNIKAVILDMLVASMDTTSTTLEWVLSELLIHPRIMTKVQKELKEKVGMNRRVEESDLEGLEYLDMVIKETFRLHAVVPLLLPHQAIEDCTVSGYFIPKGSHIMINTWTIGRDPSVWKDANKFIPERFAGNDIDIRGHDFRLLPFGSGRRSCPGIQLGMTLVRLILAQLVHCFDWKLADDILPSDLDMSEEFSLVVHRSQHLLAIPTYRLRV